MGSYTCSKRYFELFLFCEKMMGYYWTLLLLGVTLIPESLSFQSLVSKNYKNSPNHAFISMGMQKVKGGSVVALVTPMDSAGRVDYPKLIKLLEWHKEQSSDGLVILGTTGESNTISASERSEIIKTSVQAVGDYLPIIVGTGAIETSKVIEMSQNALDCGAHASLVITPYYVKPPQRALVKHFRTIADSCAMPMLVYNCPGRTGVDMKPETVGEISSHPNIIGIKDATGDLDRVALLRKYCGQDFLLYSGEDDSGCEFVRRGGDGVISVTANVAPAAMHKMLLAAKTGNNAEADTINDMLMPLHQRLFLESNPIPVKKAVELMGRIGSGIRPPLCELDPQHLDALKEAMKIGKVI